jgi:hypothetical protein
MKITQTLITLKNEILILSNIPLLLLPGFYTFSKTISFSVFLIFLLFAIFSQDKQSRINITQNENLPRLKQHY